MIFGEAQVKSWRPGSGRPGQEHGRSGAAFVVNIRSDRGPPERLASRLARGGGRSSTAVMLSPGCSEDDATAVKDTG
jgi:hypothetical protein